MLDLGVKHENQCNPILYQLYLVEWSTIVFPTTWLCVSSRMFYCWVIEIFYWIFQHVTKAPFRKLGTAFSYNYLCASVVLSMYGKLPPSITNSCTYLSNDLQKTNEVSDFHTITYHQKNLYIYQS